MMGLWGKKKVQLDKMQAEAVAAFESGDVSNAMQGFTQLCNIEPNSERLYYLGVLQDMIGDPKESTKVLRRSVKMDPKNSQAWYSLSIVYYKLENIESSYNSIAEAYKSGPNDFRIVNHYAMLMTSSPFPEHQNPQKAVTLAKHACELTDWKDEICLGTYQAAMKAAGIKVENAPAKKGSAEKSIASGQGDSTLEIISHVEKRFKKKVDALALQNIVPFDVPVAVQTISSASGKGPAIVFTTGMSSKSMVIRDKKEDLLFAELCMVMPGSWNVDRKIDAKIWPWHQLQQLAILPHKNQVAYTRHPQVIVLGDEQDSPSSLGVGVDFCAYFLLPNVNGYIDRFVSKTGRRVSFILAMPIYREELRLAQGPNGIKKLFARIRETKTKPHMTPGRPNLGLN